MVITPRVENIKVGQVIKNYKEFCSLLDIEVKGGKSKQIQMKKLEEFIKYHKEGNKFIIDEIIDNNVALVDMRIYGNKTKTSVEIGDVILHKLLTEYVGKEISLTNTELLYRMMFITDEYRMLIRDSELYHILTGIDYKYLNSYKAQIGSQLSRRVESALRRLKNSGYILYDKKIHLKFAIKKDGVTSHYIKLIETDVDKKLFIDARIKAFSKLNKIRKEENKSIIEDMSIIFMHGEFKRFRKLVCTELNKVYKDKCVNFWEGYIITTTKLALSKIVDDSRYNKNLEFVKSDFFELLERNTKTMREKEIDRIEEEIRNTYEEESNLVQWGKTFCNKRNKLIYTRDKVINMSEDLIHG